MTAPALRLRHVLCPTDFSEFSERALRNAVAIASTQRSTLTIVHVFPYAAPIGAGMPPALVQQLGPAARQKLLERLQAFAEPARAAGLWPQTILLEGDPAREIGRLAEVLSADMLVLGSHGRRGLERFVRGSVTEELVRRAPCPVLTVCHGESPEVEENAVQRILCATDLRSNAGGELAHAISLAAQSRAKLTVVHVLETLIDATPGSEVTKALRWNYEHAARQRLLEAVPEEIRQLIPIREVVVAGRAHEQILRVAREEASQLIVLGASHQGALERLWFGSTTQRVVREAPCPVRIVRLEESRRRQSMPAMQAASA
ncbi:MAG TPA: universal stress protein [Vicinamibacteria bacterium]|nr:universal stress protein [Vicinamibacteria bacterium]